MELYCIIVTYNGRKWIRRCIDSVLEDRALNAHIVVIDNASSDDTLSILRDSYPQVHLIENRENKGFGWANNQGISYAYKRGATHFLLLNQDAALRPGSLARMIEVQRQNDLPLVSPFHLDGAGRWLDEGFYSFVNGRALFSDLFKGTPQLYYEVPFVNAACWLLPRRTIEKIGGFDPVFFHYGEDVDYCRRLIYHGGHPCVIPGAVIFHDRGKKGNAAAWERNALLSELLLAYGIRPSSRRVRMRFHLKFLKMAVYDLFTLRFKALGNILYGYTAFLGRKAELRRHVGQNRQGGLNWLSC